jgi:hypothetical protein
MPFGQLIQSGRIPKKSDIFFLALKGLRKLPPFQAKKRTTYFLGMRPKASYFQSVPYLARITYYLMYFNKNLFIRNALKIRCSFF